AAQPQRARRVRNWHSATHRIRGDSSDNFPKHPPPHETSHEEWWGRCQTNGFGGCDSHHKIVDLRLRKDSPRRQAKVASWRDAFTPASRYPPQRGSCHGDHSRKVSRPAAAEEGVCESGYHHARWIAAGDAGLV